MRKVLAVVLFLMAGSALAADAREKIQLPPPMREHMMANMRDHLSSLSEIQAALAKVDFDKAADIAEARLGFSSLASHNAAHMAPYMPKTMQAIGTKMHSAASQFARSAQERDGKKVMADLAAITAQCVACHAAYRVH
jgi:cytochrome c556